MQTQQISCTKDGIWIKPSLSVPLDKAQLVLCFASSTQINNPELIGYIRELYPNAYLMGCSTAGEISNDGVRDDTFVATAIHFEHTKIQAVKSRIDHMNNSYRVGQHLAQQLPAEDLTHVFVLSDGLNINGSELVKGIIKSLPQSVTVTGGLSADGAAFKQTWVLSDKEAQEKSVALLGFYGSHLRIGYSSLGGWDILGDNHTITKSEGNILYELDGKPALPLYKSYLGDQAKDLPASGLLFPLSIRQADTDEWVVRTILGVDESNNSLIFAGDMNEAFSARLMKADFERLIDGAHKAASITSKSLNSPMPDLAILISCVGRKLVLQDRIGEEVEAVKNVFGDKTSLCGFYSYGEISPFTPNAKCELHNQTMTITTLREKV